MDEQPKFKLSLWRRWRQQTWKRRFAVYCGSFVLLIALFYVVENTRGTMALNAAKKRAADAGIELDFAKLMTREMPPEAENFATCLPQLETIGSYSDLHPDFNGTHPHVDHLTALPRYTGMDYVLPDDFSVKFSPRKKSHEEGCAEVLRLLKTWDSEMGEISLASNRKHGVFAVDWSASPYEIEFPADLRAIRTFHLRAMARLGVGEIDGAVSDVETILRIGQHYDERPLSINLLVRATREAMLSRVLWEGMREHQFSMAHLKRIEALLLSDKPQEFWEQTYRNEIAFSIRAQSPLAEGFSKRWEIAARPSQLSKFLHAGSFPDQTWAEKGIDFATCLIFSMQPSGWFRQRMAETIDEDVRLLHSSGTLRKRLTDFDPLTYRKGNYGFVRGISGDVAGHHYILERFIDSTAKSRLAQAAIAFEMYFLETGEHPKSFADVVPKYLAAIPIDPWTDKPMKLDFRPDGRPVIYSVGKDLDDDGGIPQTRKGTPKDGDIVWHYSLPPGFDAKAHYEK